MTDIRETLTAAMEEIWNDDLTFEGQADAVLALVGPKPLKWVKHPSAEIWRCDTKAGTYKAFGVGPTPTWDFDGFDRRFSQTAETVEAAQSAAQAHAAAAHWRNTPLGDLTEREPK